MNKMLMKKGDIILCNYELHFIVDFPKKRLDYIDGKAKEYIQTRTGFIKKSNVEKVFRKKFNGKCYFDRVLDNGGKK